MLGFHGRHSVQWQPRKSLVVFSAGKIDGWYLRRWLRERSFSPHLPRIGGLMIQPRTKPENFFQYQYTYIRVRSTLLFYVRKVRTILDEYVIRERRNNKRFKLARRWFWLEHDLFAIMGIS